MSSDTIPNVYHCNNCGKFLSNVYAKINDVKPGGWNPIVDWKPYGTCKTHGEQIIQSHWEDDNWGCMCNLAHDWDTWDWGDIDL